MSTAESSTKKRAGFSGVTRDLTMLALGAGAGAFGMRTYLNETHQLRSEVEVKAVVASLQAQAAAAKTPGKTG